MNNRKHHFILCSLLLVLVVFSSQVDAQSDMKLLIQVSPPDAGIVTPGPGVHNYVAGSQVNLSASANSGYEFVYWLGDVIEPAKSNTAAFLDAPKILIAVFERSTFEFTEIDQPSQLGISAGGVFRNSPIISSGGGGGLIRFERPSPGRPARPDEDEDEEEPELPVPEVPEPATGAMFLLGTFLLLKQKNKSVSHDKG